MAISGIGIIFVAAAPIFLMMGAGAVFCSYFDLLARIRKLRDDQKKE